MAKHLMNYIKENNMSELVYLGDSLKEELGIKYKLYEVDGKELIVLNYCQIDSPKTHPVVIECRGTILEKTEGGIQVVCKPFNRFFNYGEALNVTEDFQLSRAEVLEKVDGSLIKVYYWNGSWRIATRGTAFAESENYTGKVFLDMVLEAFGVESLEEFNKGLGRQINKDMTYLFEFISPENRVVTPYKESEMVLLGSVCNYTYKEFYDPMNLQIIADLFIYRGLNVRAPKVFTTYDEKHKLMEQVKGLDEGFVCYDPVSGVRVKIKSDAYVAVHKIRGEAIPTPKRIMALVVENEQDEYLTYFPEDEVLFQPYVKSFAEFSLDMLKNYMNVRSISSQKEFALSITHLPYKSLFFMARKNGTMPIDEFKKLDNNQKVKYLSTYIEHLGG